jgi:hypothetical protein
MRSLAFFLGGVLVAAAAYELALALGVSHIGPEPGEGAPGSGLVQAIALVAIVAGLLVGLVGTLTPQRAAAPLAPAAALFVLGLEYTYDSYYAPTERRFADGGAVPVWWVLLVLAGALAVGAFTWRWPRLGGVLTAVALFVCGITAVFVGDGH